MSLSPHVSSFPRFLTKNHTKIRHQFITLVACKQQYFHTTHYLTNNSTGFHKEHEQEHVPDHERKEFSQHDAQDMHQQQNEAHQEFDSGELTPEQQQASTTLFKRVASVAGLLGGIAVHQAQTPEAQERLKDPKFMADALNRAKKAFLIATLINVVFLVVFMSTLYWYLEATSLSDFIRKFAGMFSSATHAAGMTPLSTKERITWEDEQKVKMVKGGLMKFMGMTDLNEELMNDDDTKEMLMDLHGTVDHGKMLQYRM